jgi:hypothetical protein
MASRIAYYSSKFTISIYINVAAYLDTTTGSQFIYLFPLTTPGASSSVLGDIVAIILIMAGKSYNELGQDRHQRLMKIILHPVHYRLIHLKRIYNF